MDAPAQKPDGFKDIETTPLSESITAGQTPISVTTRPPNAFRSKRLLSDAPFLILIPVLLPAAASGAPAASQIPDIFPPGSFAATPGLTPGQRSVANALLDQGCPVLIDAPAGELTPGEADLLTTCTALRQANRPTLAQDLRELAPDEVVVQGRTAITVPYTQTANITQRLAAVRGGAGGISLAGLNVHQDGRPISLAALDGGFAGALGGGAATGAVGTLNERLGIFVNGSVGDGERDESIREPGFDFDTRGITAGLDYRFTDNLVLGAAVGYADIDSDLDDGSDVELDGYSASLFGTYYQDDTFYIDGIASIGRNDYDTSRVIAFSIVNQEALSDTESDQYSFSVGSGYNFNRGALNYGPYAQLNYAEADIDGYEEEPSDPNAGGAGSLLSIDDQDVESFNTVLGAQASYAISTGAGVFVPQIRAGWVHEFEDDNRLIEGQFLNDPTDTFFAVPTDDPDRDYFNLALSLSTTLVGNIAGFVQYATVLGHDEVDQDVFTGGIRLSF